MIIALFAIELLENCCIANGQQQNNIVKWYIYNIIVSYAKKNMTIITLFIIILKQINK